MHLQSAFNRSRDSIAFSRSSPESLRVHIAQLMQLIECEDGANSLIGGDRKDSGAFAEEMRSHDLIFLAILSIRVAFEANSMDPR